jgi:hypothetical protein
MALRIDHDAARTVLEEAVASRESPATVWVDRIKHFSSLMPDGAPKTHIAMLGTAILAKATDARVDVFALKTTRGGANAYSARSLAQHVLAAEAIRLGIDLGVTGREPLNNQPYFRSDRIDEAMEDIIRGDGLPAFRELCGILSELSTMGVDEARGVLRAFVVVRKREPPTALGNTGHFTALPSQLVEAIEEFVAERSEGGRRAQAVAAGLADEAFGDEKVILGRINDPDRRWPGDVVLQRIEPPFQVTRAIEVRDKVVKEPDLFHFVHKCLERRVDRAAVLCVSRHQPQLDSIAARDRAHSLGVTLRVYIGWRELLDDAVFSSKRPPRELIGGVGHRIFERLWELEVSSEGIDAWRRIVDQFSHRG